ncbi:hypothetical protein VTN02DRAFT_2089 [Thermoascus thermophilus]
MRPISAASRAARSRDFITSTSTYYQRFLCFESPIAKQSKAMISRIRRALASLLLPRRRRASREEHQAPVETVAGPAAEDLREQESSSAEVSVVKIEGQDDPSSDSHLFQTAEHGRPPLPTPPTSTKKESGVSTDYLLHLLPPSVADAGRDDGRGSPIAFLCPRSPGSPSTDTFQPRTPPASVPKKRKRRGSESLDGDGPVLVKIERAGTSECERSTRKRKRVSSNRDPTFRLSSVLRDSSDSDLDGDTLVESGRKKRKRKTKNGAYGVAPVSQDKHSEGHQPRGTLWNRDSEWGSTPSKRSRPGLRDAPSLPPREKSIIAPDAVEGGTSDEEEWTEKNAVQKHDKDHVAFDFSMEKAKRWAGAVTLPDGKWAEAEQDLYFRLAMRGFEPLVPSHWHLDFPTLPDTLFALRDGPEPLIQALGDNEFRAIKFLGDLLSLGSRVRDRQFTPLGPESIIERTVKRYLGWALRDANIHNRPNAIPVYDIYTMRQGQSTREAVTRLNCRLISLAKRYRDSLRLAQRIENLQNEGSSGRETQVHYSRERKFPVLTGFLICGPIVAVTTLDSDPNACPDLDSGVSCKLIAQFDMGERGQDVWNALAIAITVMRVRKTMLELAEEGQGDWMWMIDDNHPHDDTDEDT